jgi:hypothetical protein
MVTGEVDGGAESLRSSRQCAGTQRGIPC